MCGISIAINTTNNPILSGQIQAMNNKIGHRGPDNDGFFYGKNFALGHRRLSILDLSEAGTQPMQWKNFWITYNGEVYNYVELRKELTDLGYTFRTGTDTEVILAAFEEWGTNAFAKFNGMWAFAIYDSLKNEIILCRDHFGIKPLYYSKFDKYFVAGSEIKQFIAFDTFKPVLEKAVAINFLEKGWLNYSNHTFFENVRELRPGHYLVYDLSEHKYSITQWYNLDKEVKPIKDTYKLAVEKVRNLFIDSVRIRMRSDVRVGSCLSGGIDSSSIVSTVYTNNLANEDFSTITSCYADKKYDEQKFSDIISDQTGFTPLKVFPDLDNLYKQGDLDKIIYHQDQPIGGASHYSEFNVFKTARENRMIVMLDGQGSDEYFCGYGEFFIIRIKELARQFKFLAIYKMFRNKAIHTNTSVSFQIKSYLKTVYFFKLISAIKKLLGKEYKLLTNKWKTIAKKSIIEFEVDNIRDLSVMEVQHSSIPYQLHSEDRNSMLFSIESRLPFLDPRLVEYGIGLPSSYKIRNGFTKAVLRDAMKELPEPIKYRKDKMGFVAPDAPWMRQNKEWVRTELLDLVKTKGIYKMDLVNRFDDFIAGNLGYDQVFFRAMAFNRFCNIFKMEIN